MTRPDEGIRRSIYLSPELDQRVRAAAIAESADRGHMVSMSEWVRDAIERKLTQLARRKT